MSIVRETSSKSSLNLGLVHFCKLPRGNWWSLISALKPPKHAEPVDASGLIFGVELEPKLGKVLPQKKTLNHKASDWQEKLLKPSHNAKKTSSSTFSHWKKQTPSFANCSKILPNWWSQLNQLPPIPQPAASFPQPANLSPWAGQAFPVLPWLFRVPASNSVRKMLASSGRAGNVVPIVAEIALRLCRGCRAGVLEGLVEGHGKMSKKKKGDLFSFS